MGAPCLHVCALDHLPLHDHRCTGHGPCGGPPPWLPPLSTQKLAAAESDSLSALLATSMRHCCSHADALHALSTTQSPSCSVDGVSVRAEPMPFSASSHVLGSPGKSHMSGRLSGLPVRREG